MNLPFVLITEPISDAPLRWLKQRARVEVAQPTPELLASAQALIVRTYTRVDSEMLDRAPNLRVVARAGVGLDNIDLVACIERGIPVVHTPGANSLAVVEYVISMMLSALRPIDRLSTPLSMDHWQIRRTSAATSRSCAGATLGIVGLGRIGSLVARAASTLGMSVRYHDLLDIDPSQRHGATPVDLESLARECEVISVHVDGRSDNRHMLNDAFFSMLRADVVLLNASRGFVLESDAAARFATSNPDSRLVLDVHETEPLGSDWALWGLENVTLTPHIAAATRSAKEAMSWVVRDVMRVLNNEQPQHPAG